MSSSPVASAGEMADQLEEFLVERRYASQELPRFMRGLFARESAREPLYLNQQQLQATMAVGARLSQLTILDYLK